MNENRTRVRFEVTSGTLDTGRLAVRISVDER